MDSADGADAGEPVVDHAMAEILKRGNDPAAAVVAADDDVADFEDIDGVLHDGEYVEVGLGHDVGDVAVDENLTWCEAGDLVGGHAAVRAADPEVFRALLVGELAEEIRIVRDDGRRPFAVVSE